MPDIKLNMTLDEPSATLSRADRVHYTLREEIFDMHLRAGDRFTEGALAERFAVSRTPAREALQRLQSDGLMRGYVRGGWEVVPIDNERFDDLYEMREMIETGADIRPRGNCAWAAPAQSPGALNVPNR